MRNDRLPSTAEYGFALMAAQAACMMPNGLYNRAAFFTRENLMNKNKIFAITALGAALSGCFGAGDIECDSKVTQQRIIKDFTDHLHKMLPASALQHITGIALEEIITLEADKDAKTRSCEARVVVKTQDKESFAYQGIKYTNQTVTGGDTTTRTVYTYGDTFQHIAGYTMQAIEGVALRAEAKKAGFVSYEKFERYRDVQQRIKLNEGLSQTVAAKMEKNLEQWETLEQQVAPLRSAMQEGKTIIATNQYLEMAPVTLSNSNRIIESSAWNQNSITFKAQVKNLHSTALDDMSFDAYVFLNDEGSPFISPGYTSTSNLKGIKPGETRSVTFKITEEILRSGTRMSSTTWKEAKTYRVVLMPTRFTGGDGQAYRIGGTTRPTGFASRRNIHGTQEAAAEQIIWIKHFELNEEINSARRQILHFEQEIAEDRRLLGILEEEKGLP